MAGGQPGSNSRGRGGKFKKYTRGGGKHFSRDLRPVDAEGNEISMWAVDKQGNKGEEDSDSEEDSDDSSEDSSDEDASASGLQGQKGAVSREERKEAARKRKEAAIAKKKAQAVSVGDMPSDSDEDEDEDDEDMPANPNHSKAARNQTKAPAVEDVADDVKKMSVSGNRKERESAEAAIAKEKYRRLHEAGKTDEAKADLARLKQIREQREADAARKQAEKEEREEREKERRAEFEAKEAKKRDAALGKKGGKKK